MLKKIMKGLCLPAPEIEALKQGKTILALPGRFLQVQELLLCPVTESLSDLLFYEQYQRQFWKDAERARDVLKGDSLEMTIWAKVEYCRIWDNWQNISHLSKLTVWESKALEKMLQQRAQIACLRVYHLPEPLLVPREMSKKVGDFIGVSPTIIELIPVLGDEEFSQQREALDRCFDRATEPEPKQKEIEITPIMPPPVTVITPPPQPDPIPPSPTPNPRSNGARGEGFDDNWFEKIATIGNTSQGHDFEKIVRKSLIFLGFSNSGNNSKASLDPEETGGAGGLDLYADLPYALVGECKATKTEKVPDGTPAQLIKLGHKILKEKYDECLKILVVAGELTSDANQTAKGNQMNVLRPETLQRMVELKKDFAGAIDLWELQKVWQGAPFGEAADDKINEYLDRQWDKLKRRSKVVQKVKTLAESRDLRNINAEQIFWSMTDSLGTDITQEDINHILIELSSPLTGYLGREKGNDGQYLFYFIRELSLTKF